MFFFLMVIQHVYTLLILIMLLITIIIPASFAIFHIVHNVKIKILQLFSIAINVKLAKNIII